MSRTVKVYLDTMLWNDLCDSVGEAGTVVKKLAARNISLVLGLHNFYECAKTFASQSADASKRAQQLLGYLREAIDADVLCAKEVDEVLAAEMWALKLNSHSVDAFLTSDDCALICGLVDTLATGGLDDRTAAYLKKQKSFAADIRSVQRLRVESSVAAKDYLKSISSTELLHWLQRQLNSEGGREDLKGHILRRFPEASATEAIEYASALLSSPIGRMARGLVRASSYYAWRCANGSLPKDLFDDMYHVLNSAYCDVYVTREGAQRKYARSLLSESARVAIYRQGSMPLDQWLESLPNFWHCKRSC